ncbi:hypothetical protein [Schleiferilactobacillus shenzhenensis]|uniref:Uncharacterized protein n=1 Tax=Schleiferilactobacillus shenzhenensis LY-73 TaxID=1231336 RepID=U4TMV3_9LACO|nr:hypothetical protein [Schleiferilactobacillus shenzhenensis]ERL64755.1 hypothetical protein L248_0674 [Schleiferilactobacillus shenzhenensis LY-73]
MQASQTEPISDMEAINQMSFLYTALPNSLRPNSVFNLGVSQANADVVFGLFNFDVTSSAEIAWTLYNFNTQKLETFSTPVGPLQNQYPDANFSAVKAHDSFTAAVHLLHDLQPGSYRLEALLTVNQEAGAGNATFFEVRGDGHE